MTSTFGKQALCFQGTKKLKDPADRHAHSGDRSSLIVKLGLRDSTDANSHVRNKNTDYSNVRVPGGKAAGPKPIKANYDADDARIVDLKQQGYTDEYVARKLADEGRIRYVARTVGSRWLRIRKALEAKEEEILEDEMSDWHEGEDERLLKAVKEIDTHIEKEVAKLQDKKWSQVAVHFADLISKKKYTSRLCRERFDGLMDGSALKPIELDSDQEGRAEMRRTRITTNKRLREEAATAMEQEEERKTAALAAKKANRAANVAVRITKAQQKKIEEMKIARMKKASAEQRKAVKNISRQWTAYNKVESMWLSRKQQAERILSNKLNGYSLHYRPSRAKRLGEQEPQYVEEEIYDEETEDEEEDDDQEKYDEEKDDEEEDTIVVKHVTRKHLRSSGSGSDNPTPRKKKSSTASPTTATPATATRSSPRFSKSASPKHIAIGEARVTAETRASPRYNMTRADLNSAFSVRNMPKSSMTETREQGVARLEMQDQRSTVETLKEVLAARGLSSSGKSKADLISRLQVYEGEEMESIE